MVTGLLWVVGAWAGSVPPCDAAHDEVRVEIRAPGEADVAPLERVVRRAMGRDCGPAGIRRAVRRLDQAGAFEDITVFRVGASPTPHFRFEVRPRRVLRSLLVVGAPAVRAEAEAALLPWRPLPLQSSTLLQLRRRVAERLRQRGYRSAAVGAAAMPTAEDGEYRALIRVAPGPRTRVRKVVVEGTPVRPLPWLRRHLSLQAGDVADEVRAEAAAAELARAYRGEGYLEAKVVLTFRPRPRGPGPSVRPEVDAVLRVAAGPKVDVEIRGNRRVPKAWLRPALAPIRKLGFTSATRLEARERMLAVYARRGFWRARVRVRTQRRGARQRVVFHVSEGARPLVASVRFPGNTVFSQNRLEALTWDAVRRVLANELDAPGADPNAISAVVGDVSSPAGRDHGQPSRAPVGAERAVPFFSAARPRIYVRSAYEAAAQDIVDLYRSVGYQNVEVKAPRVRVVGPERVVVELGIRPGPEWRLQRVQTRGLGRIPEPIWLREGGFSGLATGPIPLSFVEVDAARKEWERLLRARAHLFAKVGIEVRHAERPPSGRGASPCALELREGLRSCPVMLVVDVEEGPEVIAKDVLVRGLEDTHPAIVRAQYQMHDGEPLTSTQLESTREGLIRLGTFERVIVRPLAPEVVEAEKDVLVDVVERAHYSLELGVGASTEEGGRVTGAFSDSNLFGTALRYQLNWKVNYLPDPLLVLYASDIRDDIRDFYQSFRTADRLEYEVATGISYPQIFGLPRGYGASIDMSVQRDYAPAFAENARAVTLSAQYRGYHLPEAAVLRPLALQLSSSLDWTDLRCNPNVDRLGGQPSGAIYELCSPDFQQRGGRIEGTSFYWVSGPQIGFDLRDDPLNPTRGIYVETSMRYALGLAVQSPDHLRFDFRAHAYVPLWRRLGLATSIRLGRLENLEPERAIPVNRRYFAGGGSTVRGFLEGTLFPQDAELGPDGRPLAAISTGGLSLLAMKAELRLAVLEGLSLAVFYDAGAIWEGAIRGVTRGRDAEGQLVSRPLAQGAGFGLRYRTPIGPLSLDIGFPVAAPDDPGRARWTPHFAVRSF